MRSYKKRQCGKKKPYETEYEAGQAADIHQIMYGGKMNCYRCKACNFWHIGHLKGKWLQKYLKQGE